MSAATYSRIRADLGEVLKDAIRLSRVLGNGEVTVYRLDNSRTEFVAQDTREEPPVDGVALCLVTAAEDDDDGCPMNDPECLGKNGDCHDACEAQS